MKTWTLTSCRNPNSEIVKPLSSSPFVLTDKCEYTADACATIKPFNKFNVTLLTIEERSSMTVNEMKLDICDVIRKEKTDPKSLKSNIMKTKLTMIKFNFMYWGIPFKCPVEKEINYCYNSSIVRRVSESFQKMIPLMITVPKVIIRTVLHFDTGSGECLEFGCSFVKKPE